MCVTLGSYHTCFDALLLKVTHRLCMTGHILAPLNSNTTTRTEWKVGVVLQEGVLAGDSQYKEKDHLFYKGKYDCHKLVLICHRNHIQAYRCTNKGLFKFHKMPLISCHTLMNMSDRPDRETSS